MQGQSEINFCVPALVSDIQRHSTTPCLYELLITLCSRSWCSQLLPADTAMSYSKQRCPTWNYGDEVYEFCHRQAWEITPNTQLRWNVWFKRKEMTYVSFPDPSSIHSNTFRLSFNLFLLSFPSCLYNLNSVAIISPWSREMEIQNICRVWSASSTVQNSVEQSFPSYPCQSSHRWA